MRISFFLGRIHHAHKLLPVAAALDKADIEIDFIICDNSINLDPSTEYLPSFGVNTYHHARDYISSYTEVDAITEAAMSWSVSEISSAVPVFWITSAIRDAAVNIVGFGNYLDEREPDAVFALHEQNFFVKTLFYLAKQRDITTYSLMEGIILAREEEHLNKYSSGTAYTDVLFSWSSWDTSYYADPDKIMPVGPAHLDDWLSCSDDDAKQIRDNIRISIGFAPDDTVITFAPPRLGLYKGDFMRAVGLLAEWTRNRGIRLILKLHPFQGKDTTDKIVAQLARFKHLYVTAANDSIQFLVAADAIITQTSTVALEALALNIPLIEIDLDYIGLEQPLHLKGAATLLSGDDLDIIQGVLDGDGDTAARREFINDRLALADGKSIDRIVNKVVQQWCL